MGNKRFKADGSIVRCRVNPRRVGCCKGCGRDGVGLRPRDLCSICYANPDVRCQHPFKHSKFNVLGFGQDFPGEAPLPDCPTAVPPGPAREAVYRERARLGQALHHPGDIGWGAAPAGLNDDWLEYRLAEDAA